MESTLQIHIEILYLFGNELHPDGTQYSYLLWGEQVNLSRDFIFFLIRKVNTLRDKKLEKLKTTVFLQHVGLAGVELSHLQERSPIIREK